VGITAKAKKRGWGEGPAKNKRTLWNARQTFRGSSNWAGERLDKENEGTLESIKRGERASKGEKRGANETG